MAQDYTTNASGYLLDSCSKPDRRLLGETPLRPLAVNEAEAQKLPHLCHDLAAQIVELTTNTDRR